jgi:acyl carrier protein
MQQDIQEQLLEFICRNFMVEKDEIDIEKSLVDTGIIDSIGLIEISTFIQNKFGIMVKEEQMNRENFGSVVKIVKFIEIEIKK